MRIFPLVLSGLIAAGAPLPVQAAQPPRMDAVAGPGRPGRLADALLALAAQADVNIAFDATLVGERRTRGFAGPTTLRRALDALLDGSGLTYVLASNGVVRVLAVSPPKAPKPPPVAPAVEPSTLIEPIAVVGYRVGLDQAEARARRYDGMVQVMTADAVGKLPDSNIADALDRLPSVYRISDQGEGRYLSLRGLSQVLDTVTFNGVTIAASDTDGRSGRAAPLDVLSASAISEVEIHNVITPDRDAGAIGGLIDVRTPVAHDFTGRVASVTAEIGMADSGGGRDIHAIGGAFADTFGPGKAFGVYLAGERWVREYFSPFYDTAAVVASEKGTAGLYPDRILVGASMGRRERTSLTGALDWKGEGDNAAWLRVFAADYNDEEVRPEFMLYRRGALTATDDAFSWRGVRVRTETRHERQERPVRQYVLGGRWMWNDDWTVEGSVNRTSARELNPYLDYYETLGDIDPPDGMADLARFRIIDGVSVPDGKLVAPNGLSIFDGGFQRPFRIRRMGSTVREDITTQQLDVSRRDVVLAGAPISLKFGLKHLARIKSVDDSDNRFNFLGTATLADPSLAGRMSDYGRADAIVPGLDFPFADPGKMEALFDRRPDLFVFDAASSRENSVEDQYRIHESIWAGYLMGSLEVTPPLRITMGARVERTNVRAAANAFVVDVTGPAAGLPFARADILPTSGGRTYTNLAPAVLAKWDAGGAWVLRASSTRTFARPDYVDLAPISTLSVQVTLDPRTGAPVVSGLNDIGNPRLRGIKSRNWDVSAQYHLPRRLGWVSAAGFYKALDGLPFETATQRPGATFGGARFDQYVEITKTNAGHGHVAGVELSLRYDLRDAPAPFNGFGVLANAAFLESSVSAPGLAPRRLADQAKALYATQLYYERGRFQARLGYAYQGRAPHTDQWADATEDNYRMPLSRLDLKVIIDLPNAWRATFAGGNLTNAPYRTQRSTSPYLIDSEVYGREYRLGLTRRW